MKESLWRLRDWMEDADRIVFLGGAGVSTESGIPDFRSETGLFSSKNAYGRLPEEMLHIRTLIDQPEDFFAYYRDNMLYLDAKPNNAHQALYALEKMGKLTAVVTQNIDGLHQAAGSERVLELHGSVYHNHCVACGAHYPVSFVAEGSGVPACTHCGGMVRPDVVLYGEELNPKVLAAARDLIAAADMLIVGGTSLSVYPAAGLLQYYQGDHLVLINRDDTTYDRRADMVIRSNVGKSLKDAVSYIRAEK